MARKLQNWLVNGSRPADKWSVSYKPETWTRVVSGKAFISTILASNNLPYYIPPEGEPEPATLIKLRIADAYGKEILTFEPGAMIRNEFSDTFTNDSLVLEEGQYLEFWADQEGMQLLVSGMGE